MSEWIWWYFCQNFHNHNASLAWIEKQYLQDISYWIQRLTLPRFLPQGHLLIAVWIWVAETRVSWWCQIFHKIIICMKKVFFFKKTIILLVSFGISQFAADSPWENFLVYIWLVGFEPRSFWLGMEHLNH